VEEILPSATWLTTRSPRRLKMATSNVTPVLSLLGKQIELLEAFQGSTKRVCGTVLAVVVAAPGASVSEAVMIGRDFYHLDDCKLVRVI